MSAVLLIGYGNELRGDDAAGPLVARVAAGWGLAGLCALALHQLTPELAEPLAQASLAIFVDATTAPGGVELVVMRPGAGGACRPGSHVGNPRTLLALTQALYGASPVAWWIGIPAVCFDFGAPLSARTRRGISAALRRIQRLITQQEGLCTSSGLSTI